MTVRLIAEGKGVVLQLIYIDNDPNSDLNFCHRPHIRPAVLWQPLELNHHTDNEVNDF